MVAQLAGFVMTAGIPGWVDLRSQPKPSAGGGAFPFVVTSPARLVLIVVLLCIFLFSWRAATHR